MSFYATIQGQLQYPDQEGFDQMVKSLREGFWMDDDGFFVDECGCRVCDNSNIDEKTLTIEIPFYHYRNLSRVNFFVNDKIKGTIVGTSTDGCFEGWVIEDGKETIYQLEEWAKDNLDGDDAIAPKEGDFEDNDEVDDYFQNLIEWQSMVEGEFHSDNG